MSEKGTAEGVEIRPAWLPELEVLQWPLLERLRSERAELRAQYEADPTEENRQAVGTHARTAIEALAGDWGTAQVPLTGVESLEPLRRDLAQLESMCAGLSLLTTARGAASA